jgi:ankyrin repeat protein
MRDLYEEIFTAIAANQVEEAASLIRSGLDLNIASAQGVPALYPAILSGDASLVRLMLERGANPNFVADEPTATIYAEKPIELALQARLLMDWDRYDQIVKLLEEFGATERAPV